MASQTIPNYKPLPLRWPFLLVLVLSICGLIGLLETAIRLLPQLEGRTDIPHVNPADGDPVVLLNSTGQGRSQAHVLPGQPESAVPPRRRGRPSRRFLPWMPANSNDNSNNNNNNSTKLLVNQTSTGWNGTSSTPPGSSDTASNDTASSNTTIILAPGIYRPDPSRFGGLPGQHLMYVFWQRGYSSLLRASYVAEAQADPRTICQCPQIQFSYGHSLLQRPTGYMDGCPSGWGGDSDSLPSPLLEVVELDPECMRRFTSAVDWWLAPCPYRSDPRC